MDSLFLERATLALLPKLRIWDGWKIRIPVNTAGVHAAVYKWAKNKCEAYDTEVGLTGKHKVNLTLLADPTFQYMSAFDVARLGTAKDGEIVVLAPLAWMTSHFLRALAEPRPDLYVLSQRVAKRSVGWFVWHRDRMGSWEILSLEGTT